MIDVVGAKADAHELLEKISLFVRRLGGTKAREGHGAMGVANALEAGSRVVERFLPGGGPEVRPWIGGIDRIVRMLWHAFSADHRLRETMGVGHIVEPEPAFDAE